jgi:hypothetical protein
VINELGNPVPAQPIDRSYEAIVAIAEASRSTGRAKDAGSHAKGAGASLPAPAQSADAPASIAG